MTILQTLAELERKGEPVAVATVIRSHGSVPRHDGSKMLIYADGRLVPRDDVEALKWLNLGASQVSGAELVPYIEAAYRLAKRMSPEQIAAAQETRPRVAASRAEDTVDSPSHVTAPASREWVAFTAWSVVRCGTARHNLD